MRKRPAAQPVAHVPVPRTINLATIAIGLEVVFTMVRSLSLRMSTGTLNSWLVDANNRAKPKDKKVPYDAPQIAHDLAQLRSGALLQGIVLSVALILLGVALRRTRGASSSRWALLIIIVLTSGPLAVFPVSGWPAVPRFSGVLMGLASIAVIVLVLVPESSRYFRACKQATRPTGPGARPTLFGPRPSPSGAARPSLLSLLRPPPRTTAAPAITPPATADPSAGRSRAKVRTREASAAKGAELARARAKAAGKSKSRKTPPQPR
jgi:hypothetical protein